ncbi:rRNA maturation RNase YbeY [Thermobrachium celere]|uniref:Endoribonuclease YbeY n=1 Tax=Thermobrachium celere DSM 8682 TaxID=941824 RepID=R7RPW1_9CLOT|nr:rRNA maturation RNase YbeY [Thermobrachium celere]CDF58064.1 Metal-dependent hydrolase YbeY, involved in rRNA and/or ribosome maturation and assembly [Thermobrachium celere DSM 8682]
MNFIEIENRQNKLDLKNEHLDLIKKTIETVLEYEKFNNPCEVNVIITDNEEIREINRQFRGIDKETDVLSFPQLEYDEGYEEEGEIEIGIEDINPESGCVVLGDMVLSLEKALEQSNEYGHSFEREIAFLVVHSMLHLLGYDHENEEDKKIMRYKEEEILNKIGLPR